MMRALHTAATGMRAQELNIDIIANNLANVNTAGFKRRRAQFQDLLYQNLRTAGSASTGSTEVPTGLQVGLGSKPVATEVLFQQGNFTVTNNPLDLAIEGPGFFQVLLPDGELAYTRAGSFHLNREGQIVTADGNPLEPSITIPQNALSIDVGKDGTVSVILPNQTSATQVGQIQIATFPNPAGLNSIGSSLFLPTTSSGEAIIGAPGTEERGTIIQGFLEQSNVNVVEEMVNMIISQRAYETSSRVIRAADDMLSQVNNMVR